MLLVLKENSVCIYRKKHINRRVHSLLVQKSECYFLVQRTRSNTKGHLTRKSTPEFVFLVFRFPKCVCVYTCIIPTISISIISTKSFPSILKGINSKKSCKNDNVNISLKWHFIIKFELEARFILLKLIWKLFFYWTFFWILAVDWFCPKWLSRSIPFT